MAWKTFALDQARVDMQALFEKSLQRRYRLIAKVGVVAKELTKFDVSKLSFTFTPNLPTNSADIVTNARNLYGLVSDETVLGTLEPVTGVKKEEELKRLKQEQPKQPDLRFGEVTEDGQEENSAQ